MISPHHQHTLFIRQLLAVIYTLISLGLPAPLLAQTGTEFIGTLVFPRGTANVEILQHEGRGSTFKPSKAGAPLQQTGSTFALARTPTPNTEIEIVGEKILRQRFLWPHENGQASSTATFTLQEGVTSTGALKSGDTVIEDAVLGPILPFQQDDLEPIDAVPFFITTSENGAFSLPGLLPNTTYQIYIDAPGFEQDERLIRSGEPFEFNLQPSSTLISGTVQGERTFTVMPKSNVRLQSTSTLFFRVTETNEAGAFEFPRIPAGEYRLIAVAPDETIPSLNTTVTLNPDESLTELTLPAYEYARITGQVYDAETLLPIQGVEVVLNNKRAFTNEAGDFAFDQYVAPWPILPELFHPDYKFLPQLQQGTSYPVYFMDSTDVNGLYYTLQKIRTLHITTNELTQNSDTTAAAPVLPLVVRTVEVEEKISREAKLTLPNDSIIPIPSKGSWLVYARAGNFVSNISAVEFDEQSTSKSLSVTLDAGAKVSGTFTFNVPSNTMPYPTGSLRFLSNSVNMLETSVVENGTFSLSQIPPGIYSLEFIRPDGEPWIDPISLELAHHANEVLNLTIPRGVDVPVVVEDEEGNAILGVDLALYGTNNRQRQNTATGKTNSAGEFIFSNVGQGSATLELRHPDYKPGSEKLTATLNAEPLRVTLQAKAAIELTVRGSAEVLSQGSAYLMQQREVLLPSGAKQVIADVVGQFPNSGEPVYRIIPQQEGEFSLAFGVASEWSVSPPIAWSFSGKSKSVELQVPSKNTITITCPQFSNPDKASWKLELVNTSLPEGRAKTVFNSFSWITQGAVFEDLPNGIYYLFAEHPKTGARTVTGISVFEANTSVPLEVEGVNYDLFGVLVDSTESGVANATIDLMSSQGGQLIDSTTTNSQGAFEFYLLERAQQYHVVVQAADQREVFRMNSFPGDSPSREEVFVIQQRCQYIVVPPTGREVTQPFIFMHQGGGESFTYLATDLEEPIVLFPGKYSVNIGEEQIGEISVPECKPSDKPKRIPILER